MLSALGFLTILGRSGVPDARTFRWFAPVGAGIGLILAAVLDLAPRIWSTSIAAALTLAAALAVTGMLHIDGLADSADGLLPHLERARRLEVMAAPDVGAFALAVVPTVLLLQWAALASGRVRPIDLVAVCATSRTAIAIIPATLPYARTTGLATALLPGATWRTGLWLVPCAGVALASHRLTGLAAVGFGLAAAAGLTALSRRRLGGFTGDVLGATLVITETVMLLVLAAR